MKYVSFVLLAIALFTNCPKKHAPRVKKIETTYLSSLYEDIYKENPILAGIKDLPGIKIGHLKTDTPLTAILLGKSGFYQLLNETGIDFVIGDPLLFRADNINYFLIPLSMGYAITNYEGIRFAIFCKDKDSLMISDETKVTLVKERSDILWMIDNAFLKAPPMKINFFVRDRGLSDTSVTTIQVRPDTILLKKLRSFRAKFDKLLARTIPLDGKKLDEYILSGLGSKENVNVILYPEDLFRGIVEKDSITLGEILKSVAYELKFRKIANMPKEEVSAFAERNGYHIWGKLKSQNQTLLPDEEGMYLFDLYFPFDSAF